MSLLVKARADGRDIVEVTPASAGWTHVGFRAVRLGPGDAFETEVPVGREACFVVLEGIVDIVAGDQGWTGLGTRSSVFQDRPTHAVYAPPGTRVRIVADVVSEIGIASAPAKGGLPVRLIHPDGMRSSVRGAGSNTRYVCDILPETEPAESLLVVEVRTPAGHSSSYPPHKHDTDAVPAESVLEETYYHRLDPPQGFAFQRVYTDARDIDESMAVGNHDVVMVPRGYHPVVMPHGYNGYYLNVMAGPRRAWHFKNDPDHEWMLAR